MGGRLIAALLWCAALLTSPVPARAADALRIERCLTCTAQTTAADAAHAQYVADALTSPVPFRDGVTWYRVRWERRARLLILDDNVEYAALYAPDGVMQSGTMVPFTQRASMPDPAFAIDRIAPGTPAYLRVRSLLPLETAELADDDAFPPLFFLYLGVLAAASFLATSFAVVTRERAIVTYAAWVGSVVVFEIVRWMVWPMLLPRTGLPQAPLFYGTLSVAFATLLLFSREMLRTRATLPALDRVLRVLPAAMPLFAIAAWLGISAGVLPPQAMDGAFLGAFVVNAGAIGAATIRRVRDGALVARLFACSFGMLFLFAGIYAAQIIPGVHLGPLADYGGEIGTVIEALTLSFAVGFRMREERRLRHVISALGDIVVQADRDGAIRFVSPNAFSLVPAQGASLVRARATAYVDAGDRATVRDLVLRAARGRRAVADLRLQTARGTMWFEASVRALRADARCTGFQASLRDVGERRAAAEQLARAAALRALETSALRVDVFRGCAVCAGTDVELGPREFEVLAFLALRADPTPRDTLVDAVWPDADLDAGANALRVTITRIRTRLGARDAIVHHRGMYRLRADIAVDVRDAEDALCGDGLDATARIAEAALRSLPAALVAREWFGVYAPLLESLRARLVVRACELSAAAGDAAGAARLAAALIALDPTEETAYRAQAGALRAAGDEAGAARVERACARMLRDELGVQAV